MVNKQHLNYLKQKAEEYCRLVKLDNAIRTLCQKQQDPNLGSFLEEEFSQKHFHINAPIEILLPNGRILDLRATCRAGSNATYARYLDSKDSKNYFHLYECTEGSLHAFQIGEWTEVVSRLAGQESLWQLAQAQAAEIRRLQNEFRKWMPSD